MLGRKIIQVYPDENTLSTPPTQTGLSVRRIKSAGLRIVTVGDMNSADTLQPHKVPQSKHGPSSACPVSAITPNTTHTFGRPNPTTRIESPLLISPQSPLSSPNSAHEQRNSRYLREEAALMSSIANASSETSHRDLQIRALQQASALLNAHARDAKARATKLRGTLVDRELNPEDFVSMQRERWMEERRSQARHEESKALEQLLRKLSRTNGVEVNSSLLEAEKGSGQPPGLPSPEKARLAQRHANLVYFLNRSPTRLSFSNRPSSSPHNQLHHRSQSRPRTISDVRTLRLRSSALVSAFQSPIRGRFRSRSLNADTPPTAGHQALGVPLVRGANRSTLSIPPTLGETPELDIDDSNMSLRGQRNVRPSPLSDGGVATIFAPDSPRSLDELASDLSDVGIPSYAQDLLNGFDNIHHDPILPSLPPPRRPILEDETLFRIPSYSHPTQSLLSVISSIHQDQGSSSTTSLSKHKSSHIGLHIPAKPRIPSSSPLRRPLSSFLPSHSRQKSDDSGASSSPPDSLSRNFADQERDEDTATGESRVLQTPVESSTYNPHIAGEKEKSGRWSVPVMPKSPGKVFGKMKTRFAVLGRRQ